MSTTVTGVDWYRLMQSLVRYSRLWTAAIVNLAHAASPWVLVDYVVKHLPMFYPLEDLPRNCDDLWLLDGLQR